MRIRGIELDRRIPTGTAFSLHVLTNVVSDFARMCTFDANDDVADEPSEKCGYEFVPDYWSDTDRTRFFAGKLTGLE